MFAATLALLGAFVYGGADFLGGLAAKRLRSIVVTGVAAVSSLVLLILVLPVTGGVWTAADAWWGALSGLFGIVAVVLLYACLALGPMSILSPLTAVVSAIAPMTWGLVVSGDLLSPLGYAGLGVALVAVVLVGFIPGQKVVRPSLRGLVMAIAAGVAIGGFLIVIDQTGAESGLFPLVTNRVTSSVLTGAAIGVMVILAVRRGRPVSSVLGPDDPSLGATPTGHADLEHATGPIRTLTITRRSAWLYALGCGVLDVLANALMLWGLREGQLTVVSALTALYPTGTIVLAAIVLRERVAAVQWIGLVLALAAAGMLAIG